MTCLTVISCAAQAQIDEYEFQLSFYDIRITGLVERPERGISTDLLYKEAKQVYQEYGNKLSIESLNAIAGRITAIYRGAGYSFTRAYIPEQRSNNGVVEIRLLRGRLESIDIYDNAFFSAEIIRQSFNDLIGKEVISEHIEESIALANDIPGLDIFGFYSIGEQQGGTRLNLRVRKEKYGSGAIRADNHGAEATGKNRFFLEWEQNNLLGTGDKLRMGILQAFEPDNANYGLIDFNSMVMNPRLNMGVALSTYSYSLGRGRSDIGLLDITGDTFSASVSGAYKIRRSLTDTRFIQVRLSTDKSETTSSTFPGLLDEAIRSRDLSIGYNQELLNRKNQYWRNFNIDFKFGQYTDGIPDDANEKYWIFSSRMQQGNLFRPFGSEGAHQLLINVEWQYSEDIVPPDEQFSLAGPGGLRGFEPGLFSADMGAILSLEWFFSTINLSDVMGVTPSVYLDYGYGVQHNNVNGIDDDWAELANAGVGIQTTITRDLSITLSYAKPVHQKITYVDGLDEKAQFYAELIWRFF